MANTSYSISRKPLFSSYLRLLPLTTKFAKPIAQGFEGFVILWTRFTLIIPHSSGSIHLQLVFSLFLANVSMRCWADVQLTFVLLLPTPASMCYCFPPLLPCAAAIRPAIIKIFSRLTACNRRRWMQIPNYFSTYNPHHTYSQPSPPPHNCFGIWIFVLISTVQ